MRIWYVDVEPAETCAGRTRSASGRRLGDDWMPVWSPDSQVARVREAPAELPRRDLTSTRWPPAKATQITDGMSDARNPVFDKDGKYLYFTASTDSGPSLQPDVGSVTRPVTRSVYLAVLSRADASPFAPESDEEKASDAPTTEAPDLTRHRSSAAETARAAHGRRQDRLRQHRPAHPAHAVAAAALRRACRSARPGVLFAIEAPAADAWASRPCAPTVQSCIDLRSRPARADVARRRAFLRGLRERREDADARRATTGSSETCRRRRPPAAVLRRASAARSAAAAAGAGGPGNPGLLNTETLEDAFDPRAEWKQMYRRGVAHRARLLLRSRISTGSTCDAPRSATSRIVDGHRLARRSQLSLRRDAGRDHGRRPSRRRRRR